MHSRTAPQVGEKDGDVLGLSLGSREIFGSEDGSPLGALDGVLLGITDGITLGYDDGLALGIEDGSPL